MANKMELNEIISSLQPINTSKKVDNLIKLMIENIIPMNSANDKTIRFAIQKLKTQLYFSNTYGDRFTDKQNPTKKGEIYLLKAELKKAKKELRKKPKTKPEPQPIISSQGTSTEDRVLRAFGTKQRADEIIKRKQSREAQNKHVKIYSTVSEMSIIPTYYPAGGLNKRY